MSCAESGSAAIVSPVDLKNQNSALLCQVLLVIEFGLCFNGQTFLIRVRGYCKFRTA